MRGWAEDLQKKMETTIVFLIGIMETKMETTIVFCFFTGRMEKKMETTTQYYSITLGNY